MQLFKRDWEMTKYIKASDCIGAVRQYEKSMKDLISINPPSFEDWVGANLTLPDHGEAWRPMDYLRARNALDPKWKHIAKDGDTDEGVWFLYVKKEITRA